MTLFQTDSEVFIKTSHPPLHHPSFFNICLRKGREKKGEKKRGMEEIKENNTTFLACLRPSPHFGTELTGTTVQSC